MSKSKLNINSLQDLNNFLKTAFVPAASKEAAAQPPMDPAMMAQQGGMPPMDPAMMAQQGGMPPMDPSQMPPEDGGLGVMPDEVVKIIDEFANANKQLESEVKRLSAQLDLNSKELADVKTSYSNIEGRLSAIFDILNGKPINPGVPANVNTGSNAK